MDDRSALRSDERNVVVRVLFREFSSHFRLTVRPAMRQAAEFATALGPDRVINISMTQSSRVVVWYWGRPENCPKCAYDLTGNTSGRCPECGTQV